MMSYLETISSQHDAMLDLLIQWANINSFTGNLLGLSQMLETLKKAFSPLGGEVSTPSLPLYKKWNFKGIEENIPVGQALLISKRPQAPFQVFFGGHFDTVYPPDSSFQSCQKIENHRLKGPGVADMKGGLVVLLHALKAFEGTPLCQNVGWTLCLNPDEEIGSPGSEPLIRTCAKNAHLGLIFEPAFEDGSLVSERKGSANYTLIVEGKAAHAGRNFSEGRNAIALLSSLVYQIDQWNQDPSLTINVGHIHGGGMVNIVPDLAICRLNIRAPHPHALQQAEHQLHQLVEQNGRKEGFKVRLHRDSFRFPKELTPRTLTLLETFRQCASELDFPPLQWKGSGGVSDGNLLASEHLPCIDSLGVVGRGLHTLQEEMEIDSLVQRAQLTTLFLMKIANHEMVVKR